MLGKINFECLKSAASDLHISTIHQYQDPITAEECDNEIFLRTIHHLLFELHIVEGDLICPESGHSEASIFVFELNS
jgi:multifunctional methyltransferase subunit TRM112